MTELLYLVLAATLALAPIVSLVVALASRSRLSKAEERLAELERARTRLERQLAELRGAPRAGVEAVPPPVVAPPPCPVPATAAEAPPPPAPAGD